MSVGSLSASTPSYTFNQQQNPAQQGFSQLMQAIQSGNLQAAQQAYAAFTQNAPASQTGQNSPLAQAVSQIGTALSSGNIGQAQATVQALQSQMKAHHGGHHHHKAGGATNASTAIGTTTLSSALDAAAVDPDADATGAPADDAGVNLLA
ncbi:MAG TPA: hypothetical protein VNU97_14515 [Rhizomicrobium sp.]|jgi:hypothetical protein|nr:hypothetical protein [Rhizomicrobium sp.]